MLEKPDYEIFFEIRSIIMKSYGPDYYVNDIANKLGVGEVIAKKLYEDYQHDDNSHNEEFKKRVSNIKAHPDVGKDKQKFRFVFRPINALINKILPRFKSRYPMWGLLILVISLLPINLFSSINHDHLAAMALAFILVGEFKLLSFKQNIEKRSREKAYIGTMGIVLNSLRTKNEEEKVAMFNGLQNEIERLESGLGTIYGYENVQLANNLYRKDELMIIWGIFIATAMWGFGSMYTTYLKGIGFEFILF